MTPRTRCKHQKLPCCKPTTTVGMDRRWPYATVRLKKSVSEEKEISILKPVSGQVLKTTDRADISLSGTQCLVSCACRTCGYTGKSPDGFYLWLGILEVFTTCILQHLINNIHVASFSPMEILKISYLLVFMKPVKPYSQICLKLAELNLKK